MNGKPEASVRERESDRFKQTKKKESDRLCFQFHTRSFERLRLRCSIHVRLSDYDYDVTGGWLNLLCFLSFLNVFINVIKQ
jgi:hypothetical protein